MPLRDGAAGLGGVVVAQAASSTHAAPSAPVRAVTPACADPVCWWRRGIVSARWVDYGPGAHAGRAPGRRRSADLLEAHAVRLGGFLAEAALLVGLVFLVVALINLDVRIALEGEDMGGDA